MLFSSHNGGTPQQVYSSGPTLVGNRYAPQLAAMPMPTVIGAAQPRVSLVGATSHRAGPPSAITQRSPVDQYGRLLGTSDPLARAQATLVGVGALRNSDVVGQSVDPTRMAPGAYAASIRTGLAPWQAAQQMTWRPDAVMNTGVIHPFDVRQQTPVEMARNAITPFIYGIRALGPSVAGWPGPWPVYRAYAPLSAMCPGSPYCGTPSTPSPTSTYSPSVAVERVGTVRAAQPTGW